MGQLRGRPMRIGEFWGEESFSVVVTLPEKKQDVTALPNKVPSHVANIDKNNGLI